MVTDIIKYEIRRPTVGVGLNWRVSPSFQLFFKQIFIMDRFWLESSLYNLLITKIYQIHNSISIIVVTSYNIFVKTKILRGEAREYYILYKSPLVIFCCMKERNRFARRKWKNKYRRQRNKQKYQEEYIKKHRNLWNQRRLVNKWN